MQKAVHEFLLAAGLDVNDPNLKETPLRVSEAWAHEFLDGYQKSPAEVLSESFPVEDNQSKSLVVVTNLRFHSTCPHHLLPYSGRAHVAYMPGKNVIGFGRLGSLLDCFAHRLILQEELAHQVAKSLLVELESPAAACVIEAEQACLRLRGGCQLDAVTHSEAYAGLFQTDKELRRELWARLGGPK